MQLVCLAMDQPEQREVTIGRFGELMVAIVVPLLILGFVAVLGTSILGAYDSPSNAISFAFVALFVVALAIYGERGLAVVTITQPGLRARHVFSTELVPWTDVLEVSYDRLRFPQLVITVRSKSKWFGPRAIRIPYNRAPNLRSDWRTGLKETFGFFDPKVPDEIIELKDRVAAAHPEPTTFPQ
jgi:hypothetical protein